MPPLSKQSYAPYCGHRFTVVNVRGGYRVALETVEDLRTTHGGHFYVSDPYDFSGAWVFALCSSCGRGPSRTDGDALR